MDLSENAQFWAWDFGDGSFDSTQNTKQNPMHTYLKAGNYTVTLSASNYSGTAYKSATITVLKQSGLALPVADFNANPISGLPPLTVQFTDASQDTTGWSWDFGDGTNSTEQSPTHTYTGGGAYNVNLTVSNPNGIDSINFVIIVDALSCCSPGPIYNDNNGGSGGRAVFLLSLKAILKSRNCRRPLSQAEPL
jgi:PKD repeat protein